MNPEPGQQPITDKSPDDADAKVGHQTESGTSHNLSGKPTRDQSHQ